MMKGKFGIIPALALVTHVPDKRGTHVTMLAGILGHELRSHVMPSLKVPSGVGAKTQIVVKFSVSHETSWSGTL